jgi:hypothetical protein
MLYSDTKAFSGEPHAACGGLYREASLAACTAADSWRRAVEHYGFTVKSTTLWQMVGYSVPSLNSFGLIESMLSRCSGTEPH